MMRALTPIALEAERVLAIDHLGDYRCSDLPRSEVLGLSGL